MTEQENVLAEHLNTDYQNNAKSTASGGLEYLDNSDIVVDNLKPVNQSSYPMLLAFLGSTLVMNVLSKCLMLYSDITPFEILYTRGVISVVLSMVYLKVNDIYLFSIETSKSSMVLAGSLAGFLALGGYYMSLYHLNILDAFALDYLSAVAALLVDYSLFRAGLRFFQLIGVLCALAGLVILMKPFYLLGSAEDPNRVIFGIGIAAGVVGAIFSGVYGGMLRRLYKTVNLLVLLTFMQFALALFSPCFVLINFEVRGRPTTYSFLSLLGLLIVGGLGWVAHWSLAVTLKEEKVVTRVYPFKYLLVIIALFADIIMFRIGIAFTSILGIILMGVNFGIGAYYMFIASN